MRKLINMVGERYGKLEVVEFYNREKQSTFWKCRCDCGNTAIVSRSRLVGHSGHRRKTSCGCDRKLTFCEEMFGKRFKDLNNEEMKKYNKIQYKNSPHYKNQLDWIEMHKNIEIRRKERQLAKKLEPLNNIKFNIMRLDIDSENLKKIEQIINVETEKIKENND